MVVEPLNESTAFELVRASPHIQRAPLLAHCLAARLFTAVHVKAWRSWALGEDVELITNSVPARLEREMICTCCRSILTGMLGADLNTVHLARPCKLRATAPKRQAQETPQTPQRLKRTQPDMDSLIRLSAIKAVAATP